MARTRTIKIGFFTNELMPDISPHARLLFAGLWLLADREGRLEDRPKRIKGDLFPHEDLDADALLNELANVNFIIRYESESQRVIQVLNFGKHQPIHANEAASTLPAHSGNYRNTPVIPPINTSSSYSTSTSTITPTTTREEATSSLPPAHKARASSPKKVACDEEFLRELQAEPAYGRLSVSFVHAKMCAWCKVNGKQATRKRLINWLNSEDQPMNGHIPEVSPVLGIDPMTLSTKTRGNVGAAEAFIARGKHDDGK